MKTLYIPKEMIVPFLTNKSQRLYARLGHVDYETQQVTFMRRKFPVYIGEIFKNGYGCMIVIDPEDRENPIPLYFNIIRIEVYVSLEKRKTLEYPDAMYVLTTAIITPESNAEFHVMDYDKDERYGMMDMVMPLKHHILHIDGALRRNYEGMAVYQTTGYSNDVLFEGKKRDDKE